LSLRRLWPGGTCRPVVVSAGHRVCTRALLIGVLALLVRAVFVLDFVRRPLFDANLATGTDMLVLVGWARRIAEGDVLGRGSGPFWWAPLFPYSLGGLFALLGPDQLAQAALVQAFLGAAACALVYLLGRRLLDERTGVVAGLLAAAYGPALFYVAVFLSTTLEVLLAVATLLAVTAARERPTPRRWLVAGVIAGLACLARPNFLLGVAALVACLPLMIRQPDRRPDWSAAVRAGAALALGAALCIAPVTARNWVVGGKPVLISAAGPETYRIANSYDSTAMNFVYPKQPQMPPTSGAFWRHQARKAVLFWWGFEAPQNVNYYVGRLTSPILWLPWLPFWVAVPLAVLGLWATRGRARALLHVYVFLGAYYASVVAFFVIARWRLPLVIPLLVFAAAGLTELGRLAAARRWGRGALAAAAVGGLAFIVYPGAGPFVFPADHAQLGYILANRGAYAAAAEHLARAAAGLPGQPHLHRDLGRALHRIGRTTEAKAALERAVALTPDDAVAHQHLGRVLLALDDVEAARHHLRLALTLAPGAPAAEEVRALLRDLDRRRPPP
jgi:4-amino-4-deoxy-L-arabinose transferase-like glycosyltransferase